MTNLAPRKTHQAPKALSASSSPQGTRTKDVRKLCGSIATPSRCFFRLCGIPARQGLQANRTFSRSVVAISHSKRSSDLLLERLLAATMTAAMSAAMNGGYSRRDLTCLSYYIVRSNHCYIFGAPLSEEVRVLCADGVSSFF
jgi:hypothetical protein